MTTKHSPFSAEVKSNLLSVNHLNDGQPQALCMIELAWPINLLIDGQKVVCRSRHGRVAIEPPVGTSAADLLSCIASAITLNNQRKSQRIKTLGTVAVLVAAVGIFSSLSFMQMTAAPAMSVPSGEPTKSLPSAAKLPRVDAAPVRGPEVASPEASVQSDPVPPDGWLLPVSSRAALPANLQKAADRKLFTVDYSTGHERTMYVFADPECPNCQRLEPALNAASTDFNVVIFPVAVIGQDKSIASITPVLCLPPEQRKAAWAKLFDVGHDVLNLGKPSLTSQDAGSITATHAGACDVANKALGVNEVAYQTYRIPGTPWVIADDGRHVPQDVLQDPQKLQTFMREVEVSHAAQ